MRWRSAMSELSDSVVVGRRAECAVVGSQRADAGRCRPLAFCSALLLGLMAAMPAWAEDAAALFARAPQVVLDGPVTPLTAPLVVGRVGWGPFNRLCVDQGILREDGTEVGVGAPSCFTVISAENREGTWRLSLLAEARGTGSPIAFATTRDAQGRIGPVTVTQPGGVAPIPPVQMREIEAVFRTALRSNGIERTTIPADGRFRMPLPLGEVLHDVTLDDSSLDCRAAGTGTLRGRQVVLAQCAGHAAGGRITIDIAGSFVFDVETGMVLQHGYASVLTIAADPNGTQPRRELRGLARQRLE